MTERPKSDSGSDGVAWSCSGTKTIRLGSFF